MNLAKDITSAFKEAGLTIEGIAKFRRVNGNNVIAVDHNGEYKVVSLNEHNHGYIRQIAQSTYFEIEQLDCSQSVMRKTTPLAIVLTLPNGHNIKSVATYVKSILVAVQGIDKAIVASENDDKQAILDEEMLPENNFSLHKLIVNIEQLYASNNCEQDLCINPLPSC